MRDKIQTPLSAVKPSDEHEVRAKCVFNTVQTHHRHSELDSLRASRSFRRLISMPPWVPFKPRYPQPPCTGSLMRRQIMGLELSAVPSAACVRDGCRARRQLLERFFKNRNEKCSSQGQSLALTVLWVPNLLDSGMVAMLSSIHNKRTVSLFTSPSPPPERCCKGPLKEWSQEMEEWSQFHVSQ